MFDPNPRNHKALVLFLVMVVAFSITSIRTEIQQGQQNRQAMQIALAQTQININTIALGKALRHECEVRNEAATNINEVLDTLIDSAVEVGPHAPPPTELQRQRLALWRHAKIAPIQC